MTTYTLSWWHKVNGEWKRSSTTFDADTQPTFEEACERIIGISHPAGVHHLQLEEGTPAPPYVPQRKRKNTNAWKPRRYGR